MGAGFDPSISDFLERCLKSPATGAGRIGSSWLEDMTRLIVQSYDPVTSRGISDHAATYETAKWSIIACIMLQINLFSFKDNDCTAVNPTTAR